MLSHIETCFQSLVLQVTGVPTDRIQQVTFYIQKFVTFGTRNNGQTLETK
jgi:hypothetical protein